MSGRKPNVVFVFADQWRAQATGYAGDPNVKTPCMDALAKQALNFARAVAGCPVCSPYRASFLTGQYPLTHGVFLNDAHLEHRSTSIADAFRGAGYDTAYIGKWHLNGRGRLKYIPPEDRQGFEFWRVMECTHDYNDSFYFGDEPEMRRWDGYDAEEQTRCVEEYIRSHARSGPFFLTLSWGPPHNPYGTAPERYRRLYDPKSIKLAPNVPAGIAERQRGDLAGYYAHCSALDACVGRLLATIEQTGVAENTIFVVTSDHGDMLGSQGEGRKQRPWDESILVPFLMRWPAVFGPAPSTRSTLVNAPDIMPSLLGLCGLPIPESVEGADLSGVILGTRPPSPDSAALIACYHPFGEWSRAEGGMEYRGVRTERYTYARTLKGPWLLYDNEEDPYQLQNLCGNPDCASLQANMEKLLERELERTKDEFKPSGEYLKKWGYHTKVDGSETLSIDP